MANYKHTPKTYAEAKALFEANGNKPVKLGYVTVLVKVATHGLQPVHPYFAIRQHETNVVTYLPHGEIRLSTGGFATTTTLERLRTFTPAEVAKRFTGKFPRKEGSPKIEYTAPLGRVYNLNDAPVTVGGTGSVISIKR